jgi:NTP pyrophosphatase (non-canonical NTP hydrolase)
MNRTDSVLLDVREERKRQDEKWGEQNHNPFVWLAIIGEEKGEADEAALKSQFEPDSEKTLEDLRAELVQTAATAVSAIESLDRNELA